MEIRIAALALLTAGVLPLQAAGGQSNAPHPVAPDLTSSISSPLLEAPEASYAVPTRLDRIGRIIIPVMVNGQGPFRFMLDTGANTTVLAPHLADDLGLKVDIEQKVTMNGVTGSALVPTAEVTRVQSGNLTLESQRLLVAQASVVGEDGVLGVDGLKDKLVIVDFQHDTTEVVDARRHRPHGEIVTLPARARFGKLLVVDAMVGHIKVKAVIDTGGQRTLGNHALYREMRLRPGQTIRDAAAVVAGASDALQQGERYEVPQITLGGKLYITRLSVVFGDFNIFKVWDLQGTPAIIIGMDMIGTLNSFAVDYLRDEVQIGAGRQWSTRGGQLSADSGRLGPRTGMQLGRGS